MRDSERIQRARVVAEAQDWALTPYHHMGRIKGLSGGVDCAMLLAEVYERAGVIGRVDVAHYPPDWHLHRRDERFLNTILASATETATPLAGDVACWRVGFGFAHAAIIVDPGWPAIVHSDISARRVIRSDGTHGRHAHGRDGKPRTVRFFTLWPEIAS
jgi:cell wall-associated NlpC family hydrolase